ncbi:MAG TPA: GatB/YqeY domain-containing protein [Thermoanaerobaculia bacterium]|nr:GatB/YqeY domain-containing protein [Thermoanaerobaculia bacterium]
MGALTEKIRADLTESMKARDTGRTSTLRMIQSAIKNEEIDKKHALTDDEALAVIRRAVKQRQDSIEQYTRGGREDLAAKEKSEQEMLEAYMPQQMTEADSEKIIGDIIQQVGAASRKDTGKVMKEVMAKYKGVIDGKRVQEIVARLLPG